MSESARTDPASLTPTGHDTPLHDPTLQDNQIIALYDSMEQAEAARQSLLDAGVDGAAIQVVDGEGVSTLPISPPAMMEETTDLGFWSVLTHLFIPHEDAHDYGQALDRGHAMVIVTPAKAANRGPIIETLERTGPIDFDARLDEWRQGGYDYTSASRLRSETLTAEETGRGQVQDASGSRPRGTRDEGAGSGRVRRYVADQQGVVRAKTEGVRLYEEQIGGPERDTAITMDAASSKTNSPLKP